MKEMMKYLLEGAKVGTIDKKMAAKIVMALSKKERENEEFAIVGMDGEFALSKNLSEYRLVLQNGIDCVGDFPKRRQEYAKNYLKYSGMGSEVEFVRGGFLNSVDNFDYGFFGISPAEARLMDPNQRRFLQAARNCLEDAGYGAGQLNGSNVGVFVGYDNSTVNEYRKLVSDVEQESQALAMVGNIIPVIASRLSYIMDYHGPSSIFDTSCSSTAVALYFACLSIESGECSSAIVGSSRICMIPAMMGTKLGVEASNWKAKAFDDSADGTGVGEGVGAIYVKRLKDALRDKDDIYCIIKSVSANCDGDSTGITAPNPTAQAQLIVNNLKKAKVEAESITYIEAHGTGTKLGDPIEIEGIQRAFGTQTNKKQFCAIGSSKTNLGHLDHASGIASIIKCALSLKYKELYPSLHYKVPNRLIDFTDTPVYINTEYREWVSSAPRRCAINSFGLSGTNINIILEEAPVRKEADRAEIHQLLPLTLSAKSRNSFKERINQMIEFLENTEERYDDICFTAAQNEGCYRYKCVVNVSSRVEALDVLSNLKENAYLTQEERCISNLDAEEVLLKQWIDKIEDETLKKYEAGIFGREKKDFPFAEDCHRIHLPAYPFEKQSCLVKIPKVSESYGRNAAASRTKETAPRRKYDVIGDTQAFDADVLQDMAWVWCRVLGVESVKLTDNFYELGGDSIFAMRLAAEVKVALNVELPLKDVMLQQTFEGITACVNEKKKNEVKSSGMVITKHDNVSEYEMTSSQKQLYAIQIVNPSSVAYNMFNAVEVKGPFEEERFVECINRLVEQQESLRTSFVEEDGKFIARIRKNIKILPSHFTSDNIESCAREFIRPFDLAKDSLIRIGFVKREENNTIIMLDTHHIICDGMSTAILTHQLCQLYLRQPIEPFTLQYSDYAIAVNEYEKTQEYKNKKEKLVQKLNNLEVLKIPTDYERTAEHSFEGRKASIDLTATESEKVREFTKQHGLTGFHYFLSMFKALLWRYSGQEDIVIGTPVSGRNDVNLANSIGLFINTVVIRNHINRELSCLDFVNEVKKSAMEAYDNQCISFTRLVEWLGVHNDASHNPVFDIMFSMQNFERGMLTADGIEVSNYPIENKVSKLDITLNISEHDGVFNLEMEYALSLFTEKTINRMLENYKAFLMQCLDTPDMLLKTLSFSEEEQVTLAQFERSITEYDAADTIKACIERRAAQQPEKVSVVFDGKKMTYSELNTKANYVAALIKEQGLKAGESRVAVICRRSPEMMIALLAAVKAGITYLPLDPSYPMDRLRYILEDSDTKCVVHFGVGKIWESDDVVSINLGEIDWKSAEAKNLPDDFASSVPMYMIYTSGSTGLPKGVSVTQRNVRNFIVGMNQAVPFKENQRLLSVTTVGFDIFVLESFLSLANGMEVVIASEDKINDVDALCLEIIEHKIDILQTTPSRIRAMMISMYFERAIRQLNYILIGGEPFPKDFLSKLRPYDVRVFNVYGPTETTVWSTVGELTGSDKVHVGRPCANTICVIVDSEKNRIPIGCIGELAIGGDGVSNGYDNRDELNQEKFVDLDRDGSRYFMTGDLAAWNSDGNLIITGRNDRMVKLNGYRIELDEIQSVIASMNQVKEAAVFIVQENYLTACCSLKSLVTEKEIIDRMRAKLPNYMIPNKLLILEELPHTPNGKLDINQLKKMVKTAPVKEAYEKAEPKTQKQEEILALWKKLLNLQDMGIDNNLFEMGANSLKVIEFLSLMKRQGYDIVINDVFSNPTVRELEEYIVNRKQRALIKDKASVEAEILKEQGIELKIRKAEFEQNYVLYFVCDLDEAKKERIKKFVNEKVDASLYVTHFADMGNYDARTEDDAGIISLVGLKNECTTDVVKSLNEQCTEFEETILSAEVEKEYRMAAIQNYFLDSERYSGTMISFRNILNLDVFNEAITVFLNEQGLFRADIVKKGNTLYWRQRDEVADVKIPYADLAGYTREVQFALVDRICKEIYFKEYAQLRELFSSEAEQKEFYGLLYRMLLIKASEDEYYLILPVNHAIFDAMSGEVVKRRLLEIYLTLSEDKTVQYKQQLSYADFVDQIRMGPVNATQDELLELFEMQDYQEALSELETAIAAYPRGNSTYIRFEMEEEVEQDNDNAWSRAFEVLRLFVRDYLGIHRIPFMIYYYGRKYLGREYFDTIGEFIDMIPMTASTSESSIAIQEKTQNVIGLSEKHNVNFSALSMYQTKKHMELLEKVVDEINRKTSIVFNFQGKLEENDMSVFESFLYKRLMYELNMEEAKNIHVMTRYSNHKLQLDINLPFEVGDNSLKDFFLGMKLNIINYEQKTVEQNRRDK
ncbi:amino acid adenylation domain-containing protein [Ruminiclostridium sufflavum DSM 19573]|uniref:Amino acid adenylation domain-containing protein n=1 Tax=Ruminiclostridium sufflavum DSM 19573 TaxID=1121337 RepID=A0A318Y7E6_9FIRM|nr:non-ribosomal peptide synthetase [Ruminiclostridium sufflavum]PYG88041.1 amino acid adenylation domain-containing protein [Ruminiclostridium sufflavum DSM 19573]